MLLPTVIHRRGGAARSDLTVAPAFDIPPQSDQNLAGAAATSGATSPVGVRWGGDTLVTAVRIEPCRPVPRVHTNSAATAIGAHSSVVSLAQLHRFRQSCRVPVSLDLLVTEYRYCGAGPLATAYRATLGPLPIAASRRTVVVLRIRGTDLCHAPGRDATAAALRTAAVVTRRLAAHLSAAGLRAAPLSAAGLREQTDHVLGAGLVPPDAVETPAGLEVHADEEGVHGGAIRWRTLDLGPDAGPGTARALLADQPVATTTVLQLSGPPSAPELHGLVGVVEIPGAGRRVHAIPAAATAGTASPAALLDWLPAPGPTRANRPPLPADAAALHRWSFPVGDDGPLIGALADGRAVTLPLFAAHRPAVVRGDTRLVGLLLGRCIASGAAISVHTAAAARWGPLLEHVGDAGVLALGATAPGASTVLADVDLVDESDGDEWVLRISRAAGTGTSAAPWADIRGRADGRLRAVVDGVALDLQNVAGPDECRLVAGIPAGPTSR
ncbi:MAG: type VII secretion protein EccE [Gordonia sp. (in: high G+C Gram-positive bacteria)]|uniref:type VII secretion protein EccE n=1 Tax=Gordonia sp. (in: high G+C Gram-positive bacteria) TaxID=84139 RepID=UPI0039E2C1E6